MALSCLLWFVYVQGVDEDVVSDSFNAVYSVD